MLSVAIDPEPKVADSARLLDAVGSGVEQAHAAHHLERGGRDSDSHRPRSGTEPPPDEARSVHIASEPVLQRPRGSAAEARARFGQGESAAGVRVLDLLQGQRSPAEPSGTHEHAGDRERPAASAALRDRVERRRPHEHALASKRASGGILPWISQGVIERVPNATHAHGLRGEQPELIARGDGHGPDWNQLSRRRGCCRQHPRQGKKDRWREPMVHFVSPPASRLGVAVTKGTSEPPIV